MIMHESAAALAMPLGNRQHLLPWNPISEIQCQVNPGPVQSSVAS